MVIEAAMRMNITVKATKSVENLDARLGSWGCFLCRWERFYVQNKMPRETGKKNREKKTRWLFGG